MVIEMVLVLFCSTTSTTSTIYLNTYYLMLLLTLVLFAWASPLFPFFYWLFFLCLLWLPFVLDIIYLY